MHLKRPQGNHTEAIPLLERALSIRVEKLGGTHPDTVSARNNLEFVKKKDSCTVVGPSCRQASSRAQRILRESLALLKNTLFRVAGVKMRSNQLPVIPGHSKCGEQDRGGGTLIGNSRHVHRDVTCLAHVHDDSGAERIWPCTLLVF